MADNFLGSGWKHPLFLGEEPAVSKREQSIEEAITIILSTAKGERVMRPEFGCDLNTLVFAPNDPTTHSMAESAVKEALAMWEPRITVQNVEVYEDEQEGNKMIIEIDYTINSTNNSKNMVFPFYLSEGS